MRFYFNFAVYRKQKSFLVVILWQNDNTLSNTTSYRVCHISKFRTKFTTS